MYPIPDFLSDENRCQYLLTELPHFDYVVTGNPRVAESMQKAGKESILLAVRKIVKGSIIRELLARKETKSLTKYMSSDLVHYLEEIHAPDRLQEIFQKGKKCPDITVDIVVFDAKGNLILIERKNAPF